MNEIEALAGQREFRDRLSDAGIPHEAHEEPGGDVFRPNMFVLDLDGIIARLRPAKQTEQITPDEDKNHEQEAGRHVAAGGRRTRTHRLERIRI